MNQKKKIENYQQIAMGTGLRYDETNDLFHGERDGFDFIVYAPDARYPYMMVLHTAAKSADGSTFDKQAVKGFQKSSKKIASFGQKNLDIRVSLKAQSNAEKCKDTLNEALAATTTFLRTNSYSPCCDLCGQNVETGAFRMGGEYYHLCPDCEMKMRSDIAMNAQQTAQKKEKLEEQRDRILREANEKAHAILADAKETADETMRNFHKFGKANVSATEMEKERERLRKKMEKTREGMTEEVKKPKKQYKPSDFKLGETVKVLSMNLTGTVNSLPDAKGNLFVQMGILRSQVNISDLELIEEPLTVTAKQMRRTSSGKMKMGKSMHVSPEINLLGKTVDEAVAELDKYLDDAYIAHLSPVRIVHGKGTGALRNGIHQYLRRQKHIKSFRLGAFGEGDAGVTIVEFK